MRKGGANNANVFAGGSSDDDDDVDPRAAKSTQAAMKSLFASDAKAAGSATSLKYEAKSKKDDVGASGAAAAAVGSQPPSTAGGPAPATLTAAQATVQAFRGETPCGPAAVAAVVVNQVPMMILIDRERRPLSRVRCNADLQLLQNLTNPQYATLYDPSIGQHWTLQFRTDSECTNFVTATATLLHYILLADGPVEPYVELVANNSVAAGSSSSSSVGVGKKGMQVSISMTVWLVQRLGGSNSTFYTAGKIVEEISPDAPRSVLIGGGSMMGGVEDCLVGMGAGCKRLLWLTPKKCKISNGLTNPEIGSSDSVVVLLTCHGVERGGGSGGGLAGLDGDDDEVGVGNATRGDDNEDLFAPSASKKRKAAVGTAQLAQSNVAPQQQQQFAPSAANPPTSVPTAAGSPASGGINAAFAGAPLDQNALIQTMLLQTLQLQQQQQQRQQLEAAQAAAAPSSAASRPTAFQYDLERGFDRIYQQLFSLGEKLDRLDVEGKIAKNNEFIERMVKKAVGKMPVNDVDIEDMAKDRDQLLAKIEHLKKRVEEATDNYHKALETMGKHKDEVSSLKNDLHIERETSAAKIKELVERKRLELVDLEVRHRRDQDKAVEQARQEGEERGYAKGFAAGRVDALQITGASSPDELKNKLSEAEHALVEAESRYQQQASKNYQERREMLDQIASLNSLIKRLEARESTSQQTVVDTSSAMCKTLRRALNSTYASIEAQFYATERETISVEDALAMVLISVKSESKTFSEEIKREGALLVAAAASANSKASRYADNYRSGEAKDAGAGRGDDDGMSNGNVGGRDQTAESIAAYSTGGVVRDAEEEGSGRHRRRGDEDDDSSAGAHPPLPNSEGMDAYRAMREEIEAYQRQREQEARDAEIAANTAEQQQPGLGREAAAPSTRNPQQNQQQQSLDDVDVSSLPLPPMEDDDDDKSSKPPPPPPDLFASS